MRAYKPKRANKRWQEGAPEYVLDCFDNKGQTADRYTVLLGGSQWDPKMGRYVECLNMSDAPTHPQGVSMCGTFDAAVRPSHRRVRWLDLPEHIRQHVIDRVTLQN
jgi:hypothetical protein